MTCLTWSLCAGETLWLWLPTVFSVSSQRSDQADRIHQSLFHLAGLAAIQTPAIWGIILRRPSRGRIAGSPKVGSEARAGRGGAGESDRQVEDGAVTAGGEIGRDWEEDADGEGLGAAECLIGMEGEGNFVESGE